MCRQANFNLLKGSHITPIRSVLVCKQANTNLQKLSLVKNLPTVSSTLRFCTKHIIWTIVRIVSMKWSEWMPLLWCENKKLSYIVTILELQSNLNSSNTDGLFTMADWNSFLSPYEILPTAPENKYYRKFSYFIMKLYVVSTHLNWLINAILMSTLNIPLLYRRSKSFP